MRSTPIVAASVSVLALLVAACTRGDDQVATATPAPTGAPVLTVASTVAPTTMPPATMPPSTSATTQPPLTTAPPSVVSTRAPDTTAVATTAAATTAPTTTAPTVPATTAAPVPTDDIVTVQYGTSPLGVWDGAAWRIQEWGADHLPVYTATIAEAVLTGLGLPAPITGATYGPPDYHCVNDDQAPTIVLPAGVDFPDVGAISVSANWNVQPRPVVQVGLDNPEYQALGESFVDPAEGADPSAGDVVQVVRADLDGNGVEEVLVTFEHQTDDGGFGAAGDYTLIIARYPRADGTVEDTVMWSFYEEDPVDLPNPVTGEVLAVADLNGDGVMEVVTTHTYWEGGGGAIYALVDGHLVDVAGGGCGV